MVIIDDMTIHDLNNYRNILMIIGYFEKSCGFICGKAIGICQQIPHQNYILNYFLITLSFLKSFYLLLDILKNHVVLFVEKKNCRIGIH